MVVLLTKDLFFVPVIRTAAERCDLETAVVSSLDDQRLPQSQVDAEAVRVCIVDLSAISLADLDSLKSGLAAAFPDATLCAFGSHVHANRLMAAKECGFEQVLTKSQLNAHINDLVEQWAA